MLIGVLDGKGKSTEEEKTQCDIWDRQLHNITLIATKFTPCHSLPHIYILMASTTQNLTEAMTPIGVSIWILPCNINCLCSVQQQIYILVFISISVSLK